MGRGVLGFVPHLVPGRFGLHCAPPLVEPGECRIGGERLVHGRCIRLGQQSLPAHRQNASHERCNAKVGVGEPRSSLDVRAAARRGIERAEQRTELLEALEQRTHRFGLRVDGGSVVVRLHKLLVPLHNVARQGAVLRIFRSKDAPRQIVDVLDDHERFGQLEFDIVARRDQYGNFESQQNRDVSEKNRGEVGTRGGPWLTFAGGIDLVGVPAGLVHQVHLEHVVVQPGELERQLGARGVGTHLGGVQQQLGVGSGGHCCSSSGVRDGWWEGMALYTPQFLWKWSSTHTRLGDKNSRTSRNRFIKVIAADIAGDITPQCLLALRCCAIGD
ncbi:hypothetical protein L1887_48182 [Cichorium endivia]|nr:hypothetical protein L1887_48182 [Cichorium endivia]